MKFNKKFLKWLGLLCIVVLIGSCARIFYIVSDVATSCYEDSESVTYARSLSTERLEKLYIDMEKYSTRKDLSEKEKYEMSEGFKFPREFSDLKVIKIRPEEGNIMINGCFDHYVYLTFKGIGHEANQDQEKQVVLSWGEHPNSYGEEVLWQSNQ